MNRAPEPWATGRDHVEREPGKKGDLTLQIFLSGKYFEDKGFMLSPSNYLSKVTIWLCRKIFLIHIF
jgi:hypothetical protein